MKCCDQNGTVYRSKKEFKEKYGIKSIVKLELVGEKDGMLVYKAPEKAEGTRKRTGRKKKQVTTDTNEKLLEELNFYREYAESVDKDVQDLKKVVDNLSIQNYALKGQLSALGSSVRDCGGLSIRFNESDLYEDEILDTVLSAITYARDSGIFGHRRNDILEDIITSNHSEKFHPEVIRERLKSILDYKFFDENVINGMKSLGFRYLGTGKHAKFAYGPDDRYIVILSRTPSDKRATLNTVSDIMNKIFK